MEMGMGIMPWRKDRLVLGVVGRVGVEFIHMTRGGVLGLVGMFVVLGVVQAALFVPVLVCAAKVPEMCLRVGDMVMGRRFLFVSR